MNKKKRHILTNIVFYFGILISIFALVKTYYDRSRLPEGVCPVTDNRPLMYCGIALLITYAIITFVDEKIINRER